MPDLLIPFLGVVAVLTITPGPDMLLVLRNGLRGGSAVAWATGLGCCLGISLHASAAVLGLSAVLAASATAYTVVKAAGAVYLAYLGVRMLLGAVRGGDGEADAVAAGGPAHCSRGEAFRQGLLTNLLNPKAAIMYLALIPQFISPERGHVLIQGFVLGGIQIGISFAVNALIILAAGGIAAFLATRPAWLRWQRRITGALLGAVGIHLALDTHVPAAR